VGADVIMTRVGASKVGVMIGIFVCAGETVVAIGDPGSNVGSRSAVGLSTGGNDVAMEGTSVS